MGLILAPLLSRPAIRPARLLRSLLAAALALTVAGGARAQPDPCTDAGRAAALPLVEALVEQGFESVAACVEGDALWVTYENRVFRYDVRALEAVTRLASQALPTTRVYAFPTHNGVPGVRATVSTDTLEAQPKATLVSSVPVPDRVNAPSFKADVVVYPLLEIGFGDFDQPVRIDAALAPALEVDLWRGGSATAQVVLPVLSQTEDASAAVRPGIVALHQEARLPLDTFVRASAGLFSRDRYGLDVTSTTFVLDGRGALDLRVGQTGFARFDGGDWRYTALNTTTYAVGARYMVLPRYGLSLGAGRARYLSGQSGWRAEVDRSFGEARVGVFALLTGDEPNVGGRLVLPLPVRRHPRPRAARVRLADVFEVEYRYRRTAGEAPDYDAAPAPWRPLGPLSPALFRYHLERRTPAP